MLRYNVAMSVEPFAFHSCTKCHDPIRLLWDEEAQAPAEAPHVCWQDDLDCEATVEIRQLGTATCPHCGANVGFYERADDYLLVRDGCCAVRPPYPDGTPWSLRKAKAALRKRQTAT